ncbi:MAG: SGNH/GDSL hydrolase family protein [Lentisphaeria bacterium]|nr:SGNH/GDSL hydrolase family protein [Lentisphaeria bacterium]
MAEDAAVELVVFSGEHVLGSNFGSLGDFFPATEVPCRVRGCRNLLQISGDAVMNTLATGKTLRSDRMCDQCYARLQTLQDQELPCSKPGCEGTWVWNRYQQLEAHAIGRGDHPPRGLCQKCRDELKNVKDIQQPCRMKGCQNTWTWSARDQLETAGKPAPRRLCEECFQTLRHLEDKTLPCRIKGCQGTVVWNRYQQLEYLKSGRSLEEPPHRMCDACLSRSAKLQNQEHPCRIHGCKNTWTWRVQDQLEALATTPEGQEPTVPSRMCHDCFSFYNSAKDQEQPCRNHACRKTWVWTRSMQLGARLHGQIRPPAKLCDDCATLLKTLSDREVPCTVSGCQGTWVYKADEQLRDLAAGRTAPPARRCHVCNDFLATHPAKEIACGHCGKTIVLSAQEQLDCELAVSVRPSLCADCVGVEMAQIRPPEPEPVPSGRRLIKIPKGGPWTDHAAIRDWPPRMTREKVEHMEQATVRIVCIGDEMTLSCADEIRSWPSQLEKNLQRRLGDTEDVCVLNAGIPGCSTALGGKRIDRDVKPFEPHLVVFSFAFSDARCPFGSSGAEDECLRRTALVADEFCRFDQQLQAAKYQALCWLPNPVYPQESPEGRYDPAAYAQWVARQQTLYDAVLRQVRQSCVNAGLRGVVDARALFTVNGDKSARRWMAPDSWFLHNEIGAQSIAAWIESAIVENKLLGERL